MKNKLPKINIYSLKNNKRRVFVDGKCAGYIEKLRGGYVIFLNGNFPLKAKRDDLGQVKSYFSSLYWSIYNETPDTFWKKNYDEISSNKIPGSFSFQSISL